jgi:hypothetical protein
MRDLVFKNLTSSDRKRRVIVSAETAESPGMRTETVRHFICLVKEIMPDKAMSRPLPYLYVRRERNSREHKQRFFCRIKGSVCIIMNNRGYLIYFAHSLKINLKAVPTVTEHSSGI